MNTTISYDDLNLLMQYLAKHCKGSPVRLRPHDSYGLTVYAKTNKSEEVQIVLYDAEKDPNPRMPRIIQEDLLKYALGDTKDNV